MRKESLLNTAVEVIVEARGEEEEREQKIPNDGQPEDGEYWEIKQKAQNREYCKTEKLMFHENLPRGRQTTNELYELVVRLLF